MVRFRVLVGLRLLSGCSDGDDASAVDASRGDGGLADAAFADAALAVSRDGSSPTPDAEVRSDAAAAPALDAATAAACRVGPVPASVRSALKLDAFYQKFADADGLAVLSSNQPDDRALASACRLVSGMLAKRDDVRDALIESQARFVIMGNDEGTAEVPEYGYRDKSQAERDQINQRARGLGGQVASCGEENILCLQGDRYFDESICVHEFAHTIATYGVYRADRSFEQRLTPSYEAARDAGILAKTYRLESVQEYWAEGVQDWYDSNASADPPNGIHNAVDTRVELKSFDPTLYGLVEEVFPTTLTWEDCHAS